MFDREPSMVRVLARRPAGKWPIDLRFREEIAQAWLVITRHRLLVASPVAYGMSSSKTRKHESAEAHVAATHTVFNVAECTFAVRVGMTDHCR